MKKNILLATVITSVIATQSCMHANSSFKEPHFIKLEMTGGKKIILGGGLLLNTYLAAIANERYFRAAKTFLQTPQYPKSALLFGLVPMTIVFVVAAWQGIKLIKEGALEFFEKTQKDVKSEAETTENENSDTARN